MLGVPQPMNYGQPENIGMQLGQGLGALSQSLGAAKQQETELAKAARLKEFQGAFGQAYAQQDRDAMRQLVAKYPERFDAVRQGMSVINDENRAMMGEASADLRLAASTGNPEAVKAAAARYSPMLEKFGTTPELIAESFSQSPDEFAFQADMFGLHALGPEKYFDVMDQRAQRDIDRERIAASRYATDVSARNARERSSGKPSSTPGERTVVLGDGRTVTISGKLHGAGANAFYEGVDANGQTVRVPAQAIAAPSTSASAAQSYAMKKDIEAIASAPSENLDFITGVTGGSGSPAIGADVRSRIKGKDQRELYNAAMRVQGRMQNQGVAAARDMGASGINTVAEAKMYFQGMPQVDYSSPEAMKKSISGIKEYTDNYNRQYNVNLQGGDNQQPAQDAQPPKQSVTGNAPPAAVDYLRKNPQFIDQFVQKYGYRPEGM
ncbi:MAG: phage DNA ejection protein [Shewanella sp.]